MRGSGPIHIGGQADALSRAQAFEELRSLEGSKNAKPRHLMGLEPGQSNAVKRDRAASDARSAGNRVDQSGFAGAIGPDNTQDLALVCVH
jgi:hypothetical protein